LTNEGLAALINESMANKEDISRVTVWLDSIEGRGGEIETLFMEEQKRERENLKALVKRLEDALAAQPQVRRAWQADVQSRTGGMTAFLCLNQFPPHSRLKLSICQYL
jgi:hypothetical protein